MSKRDLAFEIETPFVAEQHIANDILEARHVFRRREETMLVLEELHQARMRQAWLAGYAERITRKHEAR